MNYYERHIGDYLKDTAHLSLLEHGVYTRLMDVYYTREGAIPAAEVARLVGARSKDEREALQAVLGEFFRLTDGAHTQDRCEREIARFKDKQAKAKRSADARWSKPETHTEGNANASPDAMRTHSEGNAPRARPQSPDTSNQTPERKTARKRAAPPALVPVETLIEAGVDPKHAADWLAVRKAKKLPLTGTAWDETQAEAIKAGLPIGAAIKRAASEGWGGFKASWLQRDQQSHGRGDLADPFAGAH